MNYPSINLDRMDGTDERSEYEELIKENIGLRPFSVRSRIITMTVTDFQEIVDIMLGCGLLLPQRQFASTAKIFP